MSRPRKVVKNQKDCLVHIRNYLVAKGVKHSHIPPMITFAGKKTYATKEEWDKIFSEY